MTQEQKTQDEIMQEINDYVKEQLVDTQEMIDLLDHTAAILSAKEKVKTYENILKFLGEENVEIPSEYISKQAGYQSTSEELLEQLPNSVNSAFEIITQRQLIRFISDYRPGDIRPDDQIKEPKERLKRQAARFIVNQMSDLQKENLYHLIRSEKIDNPEHAEIVKEFDEVVGYPFEFARKTILKNLDPDLDIVYEAIAKYAHGYTKAIGDTLADMVEQKGRNFVFNSKRIIDRAETAMRRFKINIEDKELFVKAGKDFALAFAEYMEYDGEIQFNDQPLVVEAS